MGVWDKYLWFFNRRFVLYGGWCIVWLWLISIISKRRFCNHRNNFYFLIIGCSNICFRWLSIWFFFYRLAGGGHCSNRVCSQVKHRLQIAHFEQRQLHL